MAVKKSVRLTDATVAALQPLSDVSGDGMNWSGSINSMAEYLLMLIDALTPELTKNQWNALYCIYNGYFPHPDVKEEAKLLGWHLREGYQYDEQVNELLGTKSEADAFFEQVDAFTLEQKLCLIYKAKAFWVKTPN